MQDPIEIEVMVLCQSVNPPDTTPTEIRGLFNRVGAAAFPLAMPECCLFIQFSRVTRATRVSIWVEPPGELEREVVGRLYTPGPDHRAPHQLRHVLTGSKAWPGEYVFIVKANGARIGHRRLYVVDTSPTPESPPE